MSEKIPFFMMFAAWHPGGELAEKLAGVWVLSAAIDAKSRTLSAVLECSEEAAGLLPQIQAEVMA